MVFCYPLFLLEILASLAASGGVYGACEIPCLISVVLTVHKMKDKQWLLTVFLEIGFVVWLVMISSLGIKGCFRQKLLIIAIPVRALDLARSMSFLDIILMGRLI